MPAFAVKPGIAWHYTKKQKTSWDYWVNAEQSADLGKQMALDSFYLKQLE
jgi:hypothetical protein